MIYCPHCHMRLEDWHCPQCKRYYTIRRKQPNTHINSPPAQDTLILDSIFNINRDSISGPLATASLISKHTKLDKETVSNRLKYLELILAITGTPNPDSRTQGQKTLYNLTSRGEYLLYYFITNTFK